MAWRSPRWPPADLCPSGMLYFFLRCLSDGGALGFEHLPYPPVRIPLLSWPVIGSIALAAVAFGLAAWCFSRGTHLLERILTAQVPSPILRGFFGGAVLLWLFLWEGTLRFTGLGLPILHEAFHSQASGELPLYKGIFTSVSVASGFKGGEFVPLVFIGATLGSFLSKFLAALFRFWPRPVSPLPSPALPIRPSPVRSWLWSSLVPASDPTLCWPA